MSWKGSHHIQTLKSSVTSDSPSGSIYIPRCKEQIVAHAIKNLATLTIEAVHSVIVSL